MSAKRVEIQKKLTDFTSGKTLILEVDNPIWYPDCKDLLNTPLSSNFTLGEVAISVTKRVGQGVSQKNCPIIKVYRKHVNAMQLLSNRIRKVYPDFCIHIDSGYRPPFVDKVVGGSGSGPHTRGQAWDCYFSGINIPGRSVDSIRRGVAYEAKKVGIRGIELILGGRSVHFDGARLDWWITRQTIVNGRFAYPNIDIVKELKTYQLPGLEG